MSKVYTRVGNICTKPPTCESDEACRTEACKESSNTRINSFGPVANPTRSPELKTLENESKRSTRPSTSRERKVSGSFYKRE